MFFNILHRTIFLELFKIFFLSLTAIMGIVVMAAVVAEASQQGLNPSQTLATIPLLVPNMLPFTIPATTLFATCVVYGRLSHDNEILAIRAAGINILTVAWPAVLLGLLMSLGTLGLYLSFIPHTHHILRSAIFNDAEEYLYGFLKKDHCIKKPGFGYAIWVREVQGRRLVDALFKRMDNKGHYELTARAREAEIRVDKPNGQILVYMRHGEVLGEGKTGRGSFESSVWPVALPPGFGAENNIRPRDMNWWNLFSRRIEVQNEVSAMGEDLEKKLEKLAHAPPTDQAIREANILKETKRHHQLELNSVNTEIQWRPALSVGCLCFVLVGCPVGIWFSRSDYLSAFITCFLPIVFIYYPILLCGTNLSKQGKVPSYIAIWGANAVMGLVAVFLFRRLLKN